MSCLTDSGVAATLFSPEMGSLGTPTIMKFHPRG